jgi:DNA/RNA-binding domain of Phe-tRNA-synthetase-like protein
MGNSPKKKRCSADALLRAFLFLSLQKASFLRAINKKALMLRIKAFSL